MSKATFSANTTERKTTLLTFHSLWSLARLFPTRTNFEHPGLHMRRFFSEATKEFSNRRREDLTAGDASVICISILEAQDFKLKIQNPTSLLLSLCEEKMEILCKEKHKKQTKTLSSGNSPHCPAALSRKGQQGPGVWHTAVSPRLGGTHGFPPGMPVRFGGMAGTRMWWCGSNPTYDFPKQNNKTYTVTLTHISLLDTSLDLGRTQTLSTILEIYIQ